MAKDENVVIYYGGKYYDIPPGVWKVKNLELGGPASQFAKKNVIDPGDEVGYVPEVLATGGAGGYSTVLNLDAILKKAVKKKA
jgi:hypothetical protein